MGVAGLSSWLRRKHPEAFARLGPDAPIDHLYIDMASLLHSRLDALLATAAPTQTVVLAMDGPAPLAKLLEQR